jgi:hypothetical protein
MKRKFLVLVALSNFASLPAFAKDLKPTRQMKCDALHSKSTAEIVGAEGAIVAFHFRESNGTLQYCIIPYQGSMVDRPCSDEAWEVLPQSVVCQQPS